MQVPLQCLDVGNGHDVLAERRQSCPSQSPKTSVDVNVGQADRVSQCACRTGRLKESNVASPIAVLRAYSVVSLSAEDDRWLPARASPVADSLVLLEAISLSRYWEQVDLSAVLPTARSCARENRYGQHHLSGRPRGRGHGDPFLLRHAIGAFHGHRNL